MGNIYGPPDHELKQCEENIHKKTQLIEERLLPILGKRIARHSRVAGPKMEFLNGIFSRGFCLVFYP
jgi:hypothetical protein